ncbi:MAG: DUF2007 domain-containing protein [Phycisphaerae bacterium]|nr:DUF2007 domain-containing protein [Phycisphaerae bacterium]
MDKDEKLVTIAEFSDDLQAHMMRIELEAAGIEVFVMGDQLMSVVPKAGIPRVEVCVRASDVEKVKQVLAEQEPLEDDETDAAEE